MKKNIILGIAILILVLIVVAIIVGSIFCGKGKTTMQSYKVSVINYNNSLCAGTGYDNKPNGFNSGLKVILRDKITGELIQGYAKESTSNSGGSAGSEAYSCEEGIDSQDVIVSAFAAGYTPFVIDYKYPKNQLATIEVSMIKSCTGGPSYFDDMNLSSKRISDQTSRDDFINQSNNQLFETIKTKFGLDPADYKLQCIEADMGRGGYIKAKGEYKDNSSFELYYHWGWCSSGGADCGEDKCFNSTSESLNQLANVTVKGVGCIGK